jgi:hypothetical protein
VDVGLIEEDFGLAEPVRLQQSFDHRQAMAVASQVAAIFNIASERSSLPIPQK